MNVFRSIFALGIGPALLAFSSFSVYAASINFSGELDFVDLDSGSGIYSGVSLGTNFFGILDDINYGGSISDGSTLTPFSCCIAAGGLSVSDNEPLNADDANFLNSLLGFAMYTAGDLVDGINIEGDAATVSGGRIEVGLSYIFGPGTFSDTSLGNYPFNPDDVQVALFFILEEDSSGVDIYSAGGQLTAVPLPAPAWLLISGFAGLIGISRRKRSA